MNRLSGQKNQGANEREAPSVPASAFDTSASSLPPPSSASANDISDGFSGSGLKVQLMPAGDEEDGGGMRRWLIILFGSLLVETLLIGGGYVYLVNQEQNFQNRRAELIKIIESKKQAIAEAEEDAVRVSLLGTKARHAEDLLDGHLRWTKFFEHLSSRTKKTVTYSSFAGDFASRTVALDASGDSYRDVAEQIVAWQEDDAVTNVITTSAAARLNDFGEIDGVGFSLVLTLEDYMWVMPAETGTEENDE